MFEGETVSGVRHRRRTKPKKLDPTELIKGKRRKKVEAKRPEKQTCDQCENVFLTRKMLAKHQFTGKN